MIDWKKVSLNDRIVYLHTVFLSSDFLNRKGLGKETPYYICPYDPQEATRFTSEFDKLERRLRQEDGIDVLDINLFKLIVEILKDQGDWETVLEAEKTTPKTEFAELMQSILDTRSTLIPAIQKKLAQEKRSILVISGAGQVYPFIRTHTLIEIMQSYVKDIPVVLLFPGDYIQTPESGSSLDLFSLNNNDRYYRAYNIYHFS